MSEPQTSSFMTSERGALPFCPGCGHTSLLRKLDEALVLLGRAPEDVVVVTDIGCIGLADRYFTTHAFHGLHGRSLTYATGIKLARPELTVVVLIGDGGCGIGGAHLLSAARRNLDLTLIIANNFNYGMTGGQHSATTPEDALTATTPFGNLEHPLDLCRTLVAAGAPWAHRATTFDPDLPAVLAEAMRSPGFVAVDVWELCTPYFMARNKLGRKELGGMLEQLGWRAGRFEGEPRAEYGARYRQLAGRYAGSFERQRRIEPRFTAALEGPVGIVLAGSAGTKVRSTATLFAEGAMFAGLEATQKDDYPITTQTGHSISELILSPERIEYTGLAVPDHLVVLSEDGLRRVARRFASLTEASVVHASQDLELPATRARVERLDFRPVAKENGKLSVAAAALGRLLTATGIYPVEAFETAIRSFQKPAIAEANARALLLGSALSPLT